MYTYLGKVSLEEPWTNLCPKNHRCVANKHPERWTYRNTYFPLGSWCAVLRISERDNYIRNLFTHRSEVWEVQDQGAGTCLWPCCAIPMQDFGKTEKDTLRMAHLFIRQHPWVPTNSQYNETTWGTPWMKALAHSWGPISSPPCICIAWVSKRWHSAHTPKPTTRPWTKTPTKHFFENFPPPMKKT